MKLARWITAHSMNQSQAALFFGVSRATLHKWLNGSIPTPRYLKLLASRTKGEVTPNDFFKVPGKRGPAC